MMNAEKISAVRFRIDRHATLELLRQYEAGDEESDYLRATMDLLTNSEAPFDAGSFVPGHVTGSAMILDPATRRVLLIHHARLNKWFQPGGHVDPEDHDIEATAIREAREEVGLSFQVAGRSIFDLDIHEIPASGVKPRHLHFDVRLLFIQNECEATGMSDAREARWFTIDQATSYAVDPGTKRLLRKCAALEI